MTPKTISDSMNVPLGECHFLFIKLFEKLKKHGIQLHIRQDVSCYRNTPTILTEIFLLDSKSLQTVLLLRSRRNRDEDSALLNIFISAGTYFRLGATSNYLWSPEWQRLDMPLARLIRPYKELINCIEEQGYAPRDE